MEQSSSTFTDGGKKIIVTRRFEGEEDLLKLLAALAYQAAKQEAESCTED